MALNKINDNNVSNPLTISTLRVDGTLTSSGSAIFTGGSQSTVGIISRQSQVTAGTDLQQWQQGDGFVWGRVTSQGEFQFGANGSTVRLGTNSGGAAALVVTSTSTAQVGAIIKGSAGITADVFQIQNSGGSVQVRVDSNFYAHSVGWILPSGSGAFEQAFGGALLQMSKTTSTVTSPAANTARIFVKDGTTAGTLRLSTRTGIAGVEEALIDNISSTGSTAGAQFVGAGGVLTTGTVSLGSGTYDGYNADSSLRLEFRGTAGTQRPYIELQGVGANDPANENGGAFIRFRTSRAAGYGADIGAVRKSGGASTLIFKTGVATLDAITQKMVIDENGNVLINGFASGTVGLTVRGASGQSVNLYEIQNNSSVLWVE